MTAFVPERLLALALALQLVACDQPAAPAPAVPAPSGSAPPKEPEHQRHWPKLPSTKAEASRLIEARTLRRESDAGAGAPKEWTADEIFGLLEKRQAEGRVVVGFGGTSKWLSARLAGKGDAYVLLGAHHDSALQLRAFRRLIGDLKGLSAVAVEQFQADGAWQGVSRQWLQQGESAALREFLASGRGYAKLVQGRSDRNYSSYKYGSSQDVLDLALESRARGLPLRACDMPSALQKSLRHLEEDQLLRLRELHCVLALEDGPIQKPGPRRVAMLWGQAHLAARGLRRFLPPAAKVTNLWLFGGRFAPKMGIETALSRRLALTAPILLPVADGAAVLLLPGPELGARAERIRSHMDSADVLTVSSTVPGKLRVGGVQIDVTKEPTEHLVRPGASSFLFETRKLAIAGAISFPPGGGYALELDPRTRSVLSTLKLPPTR